MVSGRIFDIKRFALQDGPGLRTTVFFKGCPLSCWMCHNPEGQNPDPDLMVRGERCNGCGDCVEACPLGALSIVEGAPVVRRECCDLCGACVDVCLSGALELAGRNVSVDELMEEIERDSLYFDESGGGVTFSGGEPLAQPEFLVQALEACRERGIRTALDTTGYGPTELVDRVAPLVDLFLYDLKLLDPIRHKAIAGVSNRVILQNLTRLVSSGASVLVRVPLIPGVSDDDECLGALAGFLVGLAPTPPVDLLPYHRLGVGKYGRLGRAYRFPDLRPPTLSGISKAVGILRDHGIQVTLRGESHASQ